MALYLFQYFTVDSIGDSRMVERDGFGLLGHSIDPISFLCS